MMITMRTTITLDPDVEALVKKEMREKGSSFKGTVNDALRRALAPRVRPPAWFPTYNMGVPRIDITKALQIAGQLEDEETLRKMRLKPSSKRR